MSRYGLIAYASSFDQIGPITKTVQDAALVLEVISGKDKHDNTCSSEKVESYSSQINEIKSIKSLILKNV